MTTTDFSDLNLQVSPASFIFSAAAWAQSTHKTSRRKSIFWPTRSRSCQFRPDFFSPPGHCSCNILSLFFLNAIVLVPDLAQSTRGSPRAAPVHPLKIPYGHSRHPFYLDPIGPVPQFHPPSRLSFPIWHDIFWDTCTEGSLATCTGGYGSRMCLLAWLKIITARELRSCRLVRPLQLLVGDVYPCPANYV